MMKVLVVLGTMLSILIGPLPAQSHGGPLDGQGCHFDRLAGDYHCHEGPLAGQGFRSPTDASEQRRRMGIDSAPGAPSAQCCVICRRGQDQKACGDACIPTWKICQEPRGCACDRY